jgi:transmembrane sensor
MKDILTLLSAHLEGTIGASEKEELEQWVLESEEHRVFFQEINDPEKVMTALRKMESYDEGRIWERIRKKRERTPVFRMRWIRYAAIIVLLLGVGAAAYYWSSPRKQPLAADVQPGGDKAVLTLGNGQRIFLDSVPSGTIASQGNVSVDKGNGALAYNGHASTVFYNTLTTPRGGQYKLQLPDGTRVWLDAASSITYPTAFTGKERRVRLIGQAYLEVAHNAAQPFVAETEGMEIRDIGTAFNINAYKDEPLSRITLVEGSVSVEGHVLQPGQQFQGSASGGTVVNQADMDEALGWKNGRFVFGEKADIAAIMRQLSRWYNVDVRYEGQVQAHFGGSISRQVNVSRVLEKLEMTGEVKFRVEGKTIIVTP